jgi:2-polyprenyl-6-methoxyphenol hydroxylase-like FAD-dependent oxidoreductase
VGEGPADFPVIQHSLYRVNQRVAQDFSHNRVLLAGDSAHMNNPLGGMGMNSGIHDAWGATDIIEAVINDGVDPVKASEVYGRVRSEVCHSYVQAATKKNFKEMQETDEAARLERNAYLAGLNDNPEELKKYLRNASMMTSAIPSLERIRTEIRA